MDLDATVSRAAAAHVVAEVGDCTDLRRFDDGSFDPVAIRRNAERFDTAHFKQDLLAFVEEKYREHREATAPITWGRG